MDSHDTFTLQVRLTPGEVLDRLKRASVMDTEGFFKYPRFAVDQPFFPQMANQFSIHRMKFLYCNPLRQFLDAEIEPTPDGSHISGHFGINMFVRVFITIWFAFLGIFCISFIVQLIWGYWHGQNSRKELLWIILPFGMGMIISLVIILAKYLGKNGSKEISTWVRAQLSDVIICNKQ